MKRTIISLAAVFAAFAFVSCDKESADKEDLLVGKAADMLYASTESSLTKTALSGNDTDGYDVVWSYGDEITVGGYGGNVYLLYEGVGKTSATFLNTGTGSSSLADGEYDSFYRMYAKTLPTKQNYYPDNTIKSSPMHARVTISGGKIEPAQFHNLCGLLRLKLKEKEVKDYIEVKQIKISADQAMAGQFDIVDYAAVMKSESVYNYITLDCSNEGENVPLTTDGVDFHIALPAGTYSNVVVEVTDQNGSVCTKRLATGKTLTIERSKITSASFTVDQFIPCNLAAVDMGLSVLWANMNVGAVSPAKAGDYFAWGESSTKNVLYYSQDYYFDKEYTEYSASGKTVLDLEDDVAHVKWGGDWRMPTIDELAELFDATKTKWSFINSYGQEINGVMCYNGMKITSKETGNTIFLSGTGYYTASGFKYTDSEGLYWSSTISANDNSACRIRFSYPYSSTDGYYERHDVSGSSYRYYGLPVRPVCPKPGI